MNIEEFKTLKAEGKTNQQIADLWNISLSTLKRFIKANGLFTRNTQIDEQTFLDLYNQGLEDEEIAKQLNLTKTFIYNYRRKLKLDSQRDRTRKQKQQQFLQLLKEGKNDSDIARILDVNHVTIKNWRETLTDQKSNFKYEKSFDTDKFKELYDIMIQIASELRKPGSLK